MSISSAKPALAAREERGSQAKQPKTGKPSWIPYSQVLKRLLLILSTLPPDHRQRLYRQTVLQCLENRLYFARRPLGRLSRTPSMNSLHTWTSGAMPTTPTSARRQSWNSDSRPELSPRASSHITLRLDQKTSGLFNTDLAGNDTVAGKASDPELEMCCNLDKLNAMETPEILDFGVDLTESDFLDSFMDLSNFLSPEVNPVQLAGVECSEIEDKIDFSELLTTLSESVLDSPFQPDTQTSNSTASPQRKRKRVDYEQPTVVIVEDAELDLESSMSDHDYMVKKRRLDPIPSTSSSTDSSLMPIESKTNKYRERRDKNNVASRRSREIRKEKFVHMEKEAEELEIRNEHLRKKIEELEKLAAIMKADLIKKMTSK